MSTVTKIEDKRDHPFWRYWRGLSDEQKTEFAKSVGSSVNTLRQIPDAQVSTSLAKKISERSKIDKAYFRPDVWDLTNQSQSSTDCGE
ncbi:hypothetical protein DMW20_12000 [Vibrio parahaemolyticus]|nr:hypothetical protein [Vibrio parahaemolyticus]